VCFQFHKPHTSLIIIYTTKHISYFCSLSLSNTHFAILLLRVSAEEGKMGRKCSHCGNIGHNSRTCSSFRATFVGVRLFGVQIHISNSSSLTIKKSFSMDSLLSSSSTSSFSSSRISIDDHPEKSSIGYLSDSDGLIVRAQDRKKGMHHAHHHSQTHPHL